MKHDHASATIMIIDDEPDNLNVLGEILRQDGWGVRAFPLGCLALTAAQEEPPDLVLMDIRMPGMDGYEVCRRFKADERLRSVPVIFLSAFSDPADKVRAFEAGGVDYVTKPFAEIEVLARVQNHFRLHQYQSHLEELIRQRMKELAEADRRLRIWDDAKSQWLNTLSHEMRTPLTGILGVTELLFSQVPESSECRELLELYAISRTRIIKLIEDAQTLADMDVASEHCAVSPLSLAEVLKSALAAFKPQAPRCEVNAFLTALEGVVVDGEAKLLTRAFTDLLLTVSCCVSAGEPVTLQTRLSCDQAHVVISFGTQKLPPEALETFFDVGGQRTLLKAGGDLGLAAVLASRILRLFNGQVSIQNGPGQGLVIDSSLPLSQR